MKTKAEEFNKLACQLGYDTGESLVDAMKKNDRIETHAGYCQVIEMSREEKVAMYMKLTKKELIEMLLLNQELLEQQTGNNRNDWPPQLPNSKCTTTDAIAAEWTHKISSTNKTPQDLNRCGFRRNKLQ